MTSSTAFVPLFPFPGDATPARPCTGSDSSPIPNGTATAANTTIKRRIQSFMVSP